MSGSQQRFGIRLSLDGAEAVEQGLRRAGEAGQQAMTRISEGAGAAGTATQTASGRIGQLGEAFRAGAGQLGELNEKLGQGQSLTTSFAQSVAGLLPFFGPAGVIAGAVLGFVALRMALGETRETVESLRTKIEESEQGFQRYLSGLREYADGTRRAATDVLALREAIGQLSEAQQRAEQIRLEGQAREAQANVERARGAAANVVQSQRPVDLNLIPRSDYDWLIELFTRQLPGALERSREQTNAFQDALGRLVGEFRVGNTVWLQSAETQRMLARALEEARAAQNTDDVSRLIERMNELAQQGGSAGEAAGRLRDALFPLLDAFRLSEQAAQRAAAAVGQVGGQASDATTQLLRLRDAAIAAANGTAAIEGEIGRGEALNAAFRRGGTGAVERLQQQFRVDDAARRARERAETDERRAIQEAARVGGLPALPDERLNQELQRPDRQARFDDIGRRARDVELGAIAREQAGRGGSRNNDAEREARELEQLERQVRSLAGSLDQVTQINQRFEDGQNTLNDALQRGVITQERYDQLLGQLGTRRDDDLRRLTENTEEYRRAVAAAERDAQALGKALGSAFEDAVINGKDLGSVLRALEQDILRLLTRSLITQPLNDFFSSAFGGSGGGGGAMGWISSLAGALGFGGGGGMSGFSAGSGLAAIGAFHDGGEAGFPSMTRDVSPAVFRGAPRYHRGGVAGLMPGEIPAILRAGERIRTPEQEAALAAQIKGAGRGGGAVVVNINAQDAGSVIRSRAQISSDIVRAVRAGQRNV